MKITIQIGQRQHKYTGPDNWQKTDAYTYKKVFEVGQFLAKKPQALFLLPQVLFNIPSSILQFLFDPNAMRMLGIKNEVEQELILHQGAALLKVCEQFSQTPPPSDWKLRRLKVPFLGKNYYGPGDGLSLLTFEEFWFAEAAYERDDIDTLIAVLYRADIHRKKRFSSEIVEKTSQVLTRVASVEKEMIKFNYMGCRLALAAQYRNVFAKSKIENPKNKGQAKGGWLHIAIGMANDNATEFEALAQQNLLVALQMLDNKIGKVKEFQAKNSKK